MFPFCAITKFRGDSSPITFVMYLAKYRPFDCLAGYDSERATEVRTHKFK